MLPGGALASSPDASERAGQDVPEVEARDKPVIERGNQRFRDLNANGGVDPYENWHLPPQVRAQDLLQRMTLAEKAGLMLIDTLNAGCGGAVDTGLADDYQHTQHMHRFVFRNEVVREGRQRCEPGEGATISPEQAATHMNTIQERSESTRLGIPVLYKSNARNHIDADAREGINESSGAFTAFPKEAGIAAAALGRQAAAGERPTTGDMSAVEDFAEVMAAEWEAIGLRGMYGYMADLSTEPRWYRTHETFTEDPDLAAQIMTTLVGTLQGQVDRRGVSLSPDSAVALTMKHFPGGGPQELGLDPHYAFGKTQVYPGGAFGAHLRPFEAAIEAGVSSIMPYYGVPVDVTHEGVAYDQIGFAFSEQTIDGLLREQLGFQGYVNSDTGIINDRAWGLEEASVPERIAAAINSGTDTLSGFDEVGVITGLVADGLVTEERIDEAARRLLMPLFRLGLFEDPYVDASAANGIVGNPEHQETARQLQRESAVLLQHRPAADGRSALPLPEGSTVYVLGGIDPAVVESYGYQVINGNAADRPSAAGADHVLIDMTAHAANTSDYRSDDPATGLDPEHINPIELEGVRGLDGQSPYGAADACNAYGAQECTDDRLRFGGPYPWESGTLDFSGMAEAESWQVTPPLDVVQQVMQEVGDPGKVVLNVYFRQPYVLDQASGLRNAGAVLATFGTSDEALMDVLSGASAPTGRMPFALAGTRRAVLEQHSDTPGYAETTDGALFPFGHGLTYAP
ncbi:glycoside hydrolase family 3 N-terminal domain-containing protein [Saccharopolyspora sp. CA-218241]|uniref:glycoside hydrolase family 3 protein n=1 Tax=Saccharopolyspora sp. CA-218241 TaxID=3240027 RepID=UPI003D95A537